MKLISAVTTLIICLTIATFFVTGCTTTKQNNMSVLPTTDTLNFPSYDIVSEITEGIKGKFAEGSWKMGIKIEELRHRHGSTDYDVVVTNEEGILDWDEEIDNNMYRFEVDAGNDVKLRVTSTLQGDNIETQLFKKGEKIEAQRLARIDKKGAFEPGQLLDIIGAVVMGFKIQYLNNSGKVFKSGDEISSSKQIINILTDSLQKNNIPAYVEEKSNEPRCVIKGYGLFNDKKVIVTGIKGEIIFSIENKIILSTYWGGYQLIDPDSFVPLKFEVIFYGIRNYSRMDKILHGNDDYKMVYKGELIDNKVRNIIM